MFTIDHVMIPVPEYGILLIGYSATALSLIYRIPQVYQLWKTKKGNDISLAMIIIQQLSYIIAVLYGVLRDDYVYITGSCISFLQNLIILYLRNLYSTTTNSSPISTNSSGSSIEYPLVNNV